MKLDASGPGQCQHPQSVGQWAGSTRPGNESAISTPVDLPDMSPTSLQAWASSHLKSGDAWGLSQSSELMGDDEYFAAAEVERLRQRGCDSADLAGGQERGISAPPASLTRKSVRCAGAPDGKVARPKKATSSRTGFRAAPSGTPQPYAVPNSDAVAAPSSPAVQSAAASLTQSTDAHAVALSRDILEPGAKARKKGRDRQLSQMYQEGLIRTQTLLKGLDDNQEMYQADAQAAQQPVQDLGQTGAQTSMEAPLSAEQLLEQLPGPRWGGSAAVGTAQGSAPKVKPVSGGHEGGAASSRTRSNSRPAAKQTAEAAPDALAAAPQEQAASPASTGKRRGRRPKAEQQVPPEGGPGVKKAASAQQAAATAPAQRKLPKAAPEATLTAKGAATTPVPTNTKHTSRVSKAEQQAVSEPVPGVTLPATGASPAKRRGRPSAAAPQIAPAAAVPATAHAVSEQPAVPKKRRGRKPKVAAEVAAEPAASVPGSIEVAAPTVPGPQEVMQAVMQAMMQAMMQLLGAPSRSAERQVQPSSPSSGLVTVPVIQEKDLIQAPPTAPGARITGESASSVEASTASKPSHAEAEAEQVPAHLHTAAPTAVSAEPEPKPVPAEVVPPASTLQDVQLAAPATAEPVAAPGAPQAKQAASASLLPTIFEAASKAGHTVSSAAAVPAEVAASSAPLPSMSADPPVAKRGEDTSASKYRLVYSGPQQASTPAGKKAAAMWAARAGAEAAKAIAKAEQDSTLVKSTRKRSSDLTGASSKAGRAAGTTRGRPAKPATADTDSVSTSSASGSKSVKAGRSAVSKVVSDGTSVGVLGGVGREKARGKQGGSAAGAAGPSVQTTINPVDLERKLLSVRAYLSQVESSIAVLESRRQEYAGGPAEQLQMYEQTLAESRQVAQDVRRSLLLWSSKLPSDVGGSGSSAAGGGPVAELSTLGSWSMRPDSSGHRPDGTSTGPAALTGHSLPSLNGLLGSSSSPPGASASSNGNVNLNGGLAGGGLGNGVWQAAADWASLPAGASANLYTSGLVKVPQWLVDHSGRLDGPGYSSNGFSGGSHATANGWHGPLTAGIGNVGSDDVGDAALGPHFPEDYEFETLEQWMLHEAQGSGGASSVGGAADGESHGSSELGLDTGSEDLLDGPKGGGRDTGAGEEWEGPQVGGMQGEAKEWP